MTCKKTVAFLCAAMLITSCAPVHSGVTPKSEASNTWTGAILIGSGLVALAAGIGFHWWRSQRVAKSEQIKKTANQATSDSHPIGSEQSSQSVPPVLTGKTTLHTDGKSIVYENCCKEYIWNNGSYRFSRIRGTTQLFQISVFPVKKITMNNITRTEDGGIEGHPHLQGPVGGWPKPNVSAR